MKNIIRFISCAMFTLISSICHSNVVNYDEATQTYQVDKYGSFHIPKTTKKTKLNIPEMKIKKMKIPKIKVGK